jgi:hypothetical protein
MRNKLTRILDSWQTFAIVALLFVAALFFWLK